MTFLRDNALEIVSLTISIVAILIALYQSWRNHNFRLKMERPELKMGLTIVSSDRALELSVRNIGRGPGYLTRYEFSAHKGKWQPIDWPNIFEAMFPGTADKFQFQEQAINAPSVVEPFSSIVLFKFRIKDDPDWFNNMNHVWRVYAHTVRLRIRYKSDLHKKEYELLADPSSDVPAPKGDMKLNFGDEE